MLADIPYLGLAPLAANLPVTTATELQRQGWRSLMTNIRKEGHMLITNHNNPEAVILAPDEYDRLVEAANRGVTQPDPRIEALQRKFRERLKCLQEPGANEKLANAMLAPLDLDGKVLAGEGY